MKIVLIILSIAIIIGSIKMKRIPEGLIEWIILTATTGILIQIILER